MSGVPTTPPLLRPRPEVQRASTALAVLAFLAGYLLGAVR